MNAFFAVRIIRYIAKYYMIQAYTCVTVCHSVKCNIYMCHSVKCNIRTVLLFFSRQYGVCYKNRMCKFIKPGTFLTPLEAQSEMAGQFIFNLSISNNYKEMYILFEVYWKRKLCLINESIHNTIFNLISVDCNDKVE